MKPIERPALPWLTACTWNIFKTSGRSSLLLTGSKQTGKTTLLEALLENRPVPGVRSVVERGEDGKPRHIFLADRLGDGRYLVGRRDTGPMEPVPAGFASGTAFLQAAAESPCPWAAVDEIGFLEECSPAYQAALEELFDRKRVIAALRKADTPLLCRLRRRPDCLVLDLDLWPAWAPGPENGTGP